MRKPILLSVLFICLRVTISLAQNMINNTPFPITGWTYGFWPYGNYDLENFRVLGLDHIGEEQVLWMSSPDSGSNDDGGFSSVYYTVDPTKTYRLAVWIKKTNSNDGNTGFGCATNINNGMSILNLNGVTNDDPYFFYGDLPLLDRWYLLVGYVHPHTYSSQINLGKLYDGVTGEAVSNLVDFKFSSSAIELYLKSHLRYDSNTNDRQYSYGPRMEVVNGSEWTINELLNIHPDSQLLFVYDNAGNQKQRFYCEVSGCTVPTPPSGRMASDDLIADQMDVHDPPILVNELSVYPNPTAGILTLKLTSESDVYITHDINIYNSAGVLIKIIPSPSKTELKVDLSDMSSGMYLIHTHLSNGESITKQIIKK